MGAVFIVPNSETFTRDTADATEQRDDGSYEISWGWEEEIVDDDLETRQPLSHQRKHSVQDPAIHSMVVRTTLPVMKRQDELVTVAGERIVECESQAVIAEEVKDVQTAGTTVKGMRMGPAHWDPNNYY